MNFMKMIYKCWIGVVLLAVASLGDKLDKTYLPPSNAKTAGGNSAFLSAPSYIPPSNQGFHGADYSKIETFSSQQSSLRGSKPSFGGSSFGGFQGGVNINGAPQKLSQGFGSASSFNTGNSGVNNHGLGASHGASSGFGGKSGSPGFGGQGSPSGFGSQSGSGLFGGHSSSTGFGGKSASQGFGGQGSSSGFGLQSGSASFGGLSSSTGFGVKSGTPGISGSKSGFGGLSGQYGFGGNSRSSGFGIKSGSSEFGGQSGYGAESSRFNAKSDFGSQGFNGGSLPSFVGQGSYQGQGYNQGYKSPGQQIPILKSVNENNGDGSYAFSYETGNKIKAEESGYGGQGANGGFAFTAPDGGQYSVSYTADENGFHPMGAHLPTPPPIPEAIKISIEKNLREEATNPHGVDDGSYKGEGTQGYQGFKSQGSYGYGETQGSQIYKSSGNQGFGTTQGIGVSQGFGGSQSYKSSGSSGFGGIQGFGGSQGFRESQIFKSSGYGGSQGTGVSQPFKTSQGSIDFGGWRRIGGSQSYGGPQGFSVFKAQSSVSRPSTAFDSTGYHY